MKPQEHVIIEGMYKERNKPKSTEIKYYKCYDMADTAVLVVDICTDYRLRRKPRKQYGVNILQAEP